MSHTKFPSSLYRWIAAVVAAEVAGRPWARCIKAKRLADCGSAGTVNARMELESDAYRGSVTLRRRIVTLWWRRSSSITV